MAGVWKLEGLKGKKVAAWPGRGKVQGSKQGEKCLRPDVAGMMVIQVSDSGSLTVDERSNDVLALRCIKETHVWSELLFPGLSMCGAVQVNEYSMALCC